MKKDNINKFYGIAKFIVKKRNLFFFAFTLILVFSVFSKNWVIVENDLTAYLDQSSDTIVGLEIMEDEFYTYATASVMLSNIDYDTAYSVSEKIANINGVQSVAFENSSEYYKNASAYFAITFDGQVTDEISLLAMEEVRDLTEIYDTSISTDIGSSDSETLEQEMNVIMILAVIIIIVVLLFTSKSYAEIIVILITFGVAALVNMGTNYLFGEISFISNSVCIVLQLALAIDYAIILCHRFAEERSIHDSEEACIISLSKAIPEISSSSLTTICGLFALSFMEYGLGTDLSKVLIKSICVSLVCVFTLMPGLLMLFSKLIEKTQHRNFVPSIAKIARISLKTRYVVLPIFLVVALIAGILSTKTEYNFSVNEVRAINVSETTAQYDRITEIFGSTNAVAILIASGDYELESELISELETYEEVDMVIGLANTEAMDGYMLTELMTAREFSELMDLDYEMATLLYSTYALEVEDYAKLINNTESYELPLIDVVLFLDDMISEGYITIDEELEEELTTQSDSIRDGQMQLESDNYSRLLVSLNLSEESDETFAFIETMNTVCTNYYDDVYILGNTTSDMELSATFTKDNLLITILSALFVIVVLLFTFGSVAIPVFLIVIIQSAIFMNFAFPYLAGQGLFFIGYLVVSAIQMGANVDYAIVITNRYMNLRKTLDNKKAIIRAMDESFVTVLTSGTILASAGIIIQHVTTDGTIATLGECVGRGTIISMVLVLVVLPQLLYVGTKIIDKTAFSLKFQRAENISENISNAKSITNQKVKGYISTYLDTQIKEIVSNEGKFNSVNSDKEVTENEENI